MSISTNIDIINKAWAQHQKQCRREQTLIDKQPKPRITKKHIVQEIRSRYRDAVCTIEKTAFGKGVIQVECNHGNCDRIGQFVLQSFHKQVYTYFACHHFRKGHLSIYFKR